MVIHFVFKPPFEGEMLFDLVFDPNETNNLAASPGHRLILDDLRARLDRWMKETDDPLLTGPVPAPAGAQVNDPDGMTPNDGTVCVEELYPGRVMS